MLRIDANRMEHLLKSTLTAVQQLRTVLQAMYDKNAAQQAVLKSDGSVFTIADGIVQNILSKSFASVGMKVVGEEDALVDLRQTPFTVNGLTVASELNSAIEDSQRQIDAVFRQLGSCALTQSLTVFIDPIDGTREFNSARGEQCSINVGFALNRASIAGVIYRPINDAGWAMGAPECGLRESSFAASRARRDAGAGCRLVTTNGRMSPFLVAVQSELGAERVAAGAVGNKVLMLIEDRGVYRWDTCAAEAVLTAHGGVFSKLSTVLRDNTLEAYRYAQADSNLDFDDTLRSKLTRFNARNFDAVGATRLARHADVNAYSNMCGLFAVARKHDWMPYAAAAQKCSEHIWPDFD